MSLTLDLAYSTCPNDTFIFDAMVHQKIDTEGLSFNVHLADVEELNQHALKSKPDITKVSYFAYGHCRDNYMLLDSGSALGQNCGPLLISRKHEADWKKKIRDWKIALPGKYTTANFLFSLAFPEVKNKSYQVFSSIEDAVTDGNTDAGVIIHENRFTYPEKGLVKLTDLGEYWETHYQLPIPLGGIAVKRDLPEDIKAKADRALQRSIRYAFEHPENVFPYVRKHAQEMDDEVIRKHIDLYVNQFTVSLGDKGRKAVCKLYSEAENKGILPENSLPLFLKSTISR